VVRASEDGADARPGDGLKFEEKCLVRGATDITCPESLVSSMAEGEWEADGTVGGGTVGGGGAEGVVPLFTTQMLQSALMYTLVSMTYIVFDETVPLMCKAQLGFDSEQIGVLLAVSGVSLVASSILIFPSVQRRCEKGSVAIICPLLGILACSFNAVRLTAAGPLPGWATSDASGWRSADSSCSSSCGPCRRAS
jgi:hypothetical protein